MGYTLAVTRFVLASLVCWIAVGCGNDESGSKTQSSEGPGAAAGRVGPAESAAESRAAPPARREEHAVFSFSDNRLLAHLQRGGGLVVGAGSAGLYKYARFGLPTLAWKVGQEVDGARVGVPSRSSSLSIPLTAEQVERAHSVSFRAHADGERHLKVSVNGKPASDEGARAVVLAAGWQTVTLPVADGRLREGPNRLDLAFRGEPAAFEWLQVGGEAPTEAGALPEYFDRAEDAITLADHHGLAYYVQVPEEGHLVADVKGAGCEVAVSARDHDGEAVSGVLSGDRSGLDLSALEGKVVRLELTASGCPSARVERASLTIPGPAPTVHRGPPPKHVIFWIMDALRADKVRVATPGARAEVPTFEKLVETGASFREHYVQGNESQTSHSSFWTSLYPANHKVIVAGPHMHFRLSKSFAKLPQLLEAAGFHNVGVTANGMIHDWTGYTRGFHFFRNLMRDGTGRSMKYNVPAEFILDVAIDALGDAYRDPFFLFIGTIDTHKPWVAHEPWISKYDPGPYEGMFERSANAVNLGIPPGTMQCPITPSLRDRQRIFAIYDSDVSYQDHAVSLLLAKLAEWGIADETFLIISADHGEELWEYPGKCGHASSSRESLVRVPLILHYPPTIRSGYVDAGVECVDVLPTILDVLGMDPLEAAQGESLVPISQGVGWGYPRAVYSSKHEYGHTMRIGVWKMFVARKVIPSLYDVSADRDERENLADVRPIERQLLSDSLSLFLILRKQWKKRLWGVASNMRARAWRDLDGPSAVEE